MKNYWLSIKKPKPIMGMMGLGLLGSTDVRFIRKWRFTIEFRKDSEIIVDPCFVKIKRPHCPMGPGELSFTHYGDAASVLQPKSILNFIAIAFDNRYENITAALKLYDGCGFQLEQWNLSAIKLIKSNYDYLDSSKDECFQDLSISYKECIYENLTVPFNPLQYHQSIVIPRVGPSPHL